MQFYFFGGGHFSEVVGAHNVTVFMYMHGHAFLCTIMQSWEEARFFVFYRKGWFWKCWRVLVQMFRCAESVSYWAVTGGKPE
jgi:hypothetical protein